MLDNYHSHRWVISFLLVPVCGIKKDLEIFYWKVRRIEELT